ncbi:MAG: oxidoreductase [Myxococcales bacterium]|nr:oxidoreductase [Myxococcales bacterium]
MPQTRAWTASDLPDLTGRIVVVTGANSGLGLETALQLAGKRARIVLACRDPRKTETAIETIRAAHPGAALEALPLDLASLESVRSFSDAFCKAYPELHVLCNNAGVMALPQRRTADGFEMQLGTNHLGHFALTGRLLERLLATPGARVVNVSSTAHRIGRMRFDDLHAERGYRRWRAYGQSKLANLLFTYELQRRLERKGANVASVACHPGYAATNLQLAGPRLDGSSRMEKVARLSNRLFSQSAAMGALPALYAATADDVRGGDYIGPDGFGETWGHPKKVRSSARSHDREVAARLWDVSEELTGVRFEALAD